MSIHRIYIPDLDPRVGDVVPVVGEEGRHAARVKRVEPGEPVQLLDGRGGVVDGVVAHVTKSREEWEVGIRVHAVRREEPARPRVEVWSAAPKGDRLESMIDELSQLGVASWSLLTTARGVVEPRTGKVERLRRCCVESMKQCGRAWVLEIGAGGDVDAALRGALVVLADATGEPPRVDEGVRAASCVRVLVGPEGGFTPEELEVARRAGAWVWRLGAHVLRIETAAVAAAAVLAARSI